jgi:hypothetical protein
MNYLMVLEISGLLVFGFGALAVGILSLLKTELKLRSAALSILGILSILFLMVKWSQVAEFWELVRIAILIGGGVAIGGGLVAISYLLMVTRSR